MSQDISNLSIVWDDAGTVFKGFQLDVTDTNSAGGSQVLDLKSSGTTIESTDISGNKVLAGTLRVDAGSAVAPSLTFDGDNDTGFYRSATNEIGIATAGSEIATLNTVGVTLKGVMHLNAPGGVRSASSYLYLMNSTTASVYSSGVDGKRITMANDGHIGFASTNNAYASPDVKLWRDGAANTLALRNGANAQTFNVYNTYTSSTVYERGFVRWNSNVFEIGAEAGSGGGTDTRTVSILGGGQLKLQGDIRIANAAGTSSWRFDTNFFPVVDKARDIGTSSARVQDLYLGSSLTGSDATSNIDISTTWNTTGVPSLIKANVTDTASDATSELIDLTVDSVDEFIVRKDANTFISNSRIGGISDNTTFTVRPWGLNSSLVLSGNGNGHIQFQRNGSEVFRVDNDAAYIRNTAKWLGFSDGSVTTKLYSTVSNTLEMRAGVSPQTFEIYNTYTSSTNHERGYFKWDSNVFVLGTEAGSGGGTNRGLTINSSDSATTSVTIGALAGLNMTGTRNIAIGDEALKTMTAGFDNVAIGHQAFKLLTSNANTSVAVGRSAGKAMTAGSGATLLGANAGNTYANMTDCTIIGSGADTSASGETGSIAIGKSVISSGTDGLNIGNVIKGTMTASSEMLRLKGITSAAADPTTTELPGDRDWGIHKNTSSGTVYLAYNDGGSIVKVALA